MFHNHFFGSNKIWARSVQPFWRLLDGQTDKQRLLYIYRRLLIYKLFFLGWPRPRFQSPSPDRPQDYGYSRGGYRGVGPPPPAYRPPPHPGRNPSPAEPPPYREPPPPPGSHARGGPIPTSPTQGRHVSASPSRGLPPPHPSYAPHSPTPPRNQHMGRPPHYSPPPHHREVRGHPKGPSPGRSIPSRVSGSPARGHSSPARNTWKNVRIWSSLVYSLELYIYSVLGYTAKKR